MDPQWAWSRNYEELFMPLGARVKQLRKERGWSQDDLGEKVGTAAHQISRYENGHITPSTEMIVKLAEAFDVSLDYLLIDGATRRPLRTGDAGFLDRLGDLSQLSDEDRDTVIRILDALLAKNEVRKLAAGLG